MGWVGDGIWTILGQNSSRPGKDYIPNLRPLGHIVYVEKFVVGGDRGGSEQHVLTVILVLSLRPKLNNKKITIDLAPEPK